MSEQTTNDDPFEDLTTKLISVTRASEISGLTTSYIRRLLRQKKLAGQKIGRDWFMTEEALWKYLETERRPGPKSKKN